MKDLAIQFGAKLREERKRRGISQEKVALLTEIDRSYMGRIERISVAFCTCVASGRITQVWELFLFFFSHPLPLICCVQWS